MTQKEIKAHIEASALMYTAATFTDGNAVIKVTMQRAKMRLYYMIYIDDFFKGEWTNKESEIGQKYLLEHRIRMPKKYVEINGRLKNLKGKALADFINKECQMRLIGYKPYGSAAAIAKKFASIENLEIIQE